MMSWFEMYLIRVEEDWNEWDGKEWKGELKPVLTLERQTNQNVLEFSFHGAIVQQLLISAKEEKIAASMLGGVLYLCVFCNSAYCVE